MTRVLVVDDEPQILRALRVNLRARDYDVLTAATGKQALDVAAQRHPDIVVLDLGLPDMDGVEVIRGLRGWTTVPIVILSGRSQSVLKVHALDAGADDYVTKPFNIDELMARIRAVSRRALVADEAPVVSFADVTVDLRAHRVTRADADVRLTPTEWQLLEILVRNPGRLVSQRELIRAVRGPNYDDAAHYLRQFMAQLRQKLETDPARPAHLLTEPGMGYRFQS
ncbi:MAG TPA: response regulator [Mycobacteriales bacterium]|nr:response regulator [Mycobacteriales bacterium]HWA67691.1 response regulator [Mycobacteriales bacterium]